MFFILEVKYQNERIYENSKGDIVESVKKHFKREKGVDTAAPDGLKSPFF